MNVRPATASDKTAIAAFTRETFSWGDYVVDAFDRWQADDSGVTLVATDDSDTAIGVARWAFLSPTEVWAQGARVHPDHRRKGVSTALTEEGNRWARGHGGQVVRLVTEDWNVAAQQQVAKSGFRLVSRWHMWQRPVGDAAPKTAGNGGQRVPPDERLMPAAESEVGPAFLAWSAGSMAAAAHAFITERWTWRRFKPDDLVAAARRRAFWACPAGWLIADIEDDDPDTCWVSWMMAAEEDAYRLLRAAIDRASTDGAERIVTMLPETDWLDRAAQRAGFEADHHLLVYERPVQEG
jgi:GNAT superfamily N-acetyltransferase